MLIFATNNPHKLQEVKQILGPAQPILSLQDIGCNDDIPETADTLQGNAQLKAQYIYQRYHQNCFADDTGLEVEALNGAPGVHTARYAYPDRHDPKANTIKLLHQLQGQTNRRARFRTVITLIINGQIHNFEGIINGTIATQEIGTQGFGYDPIFIPENTQQTFAQLGPQIKNQLSHRAKAIQQLQQFLTTHQL